MDDLSVPQRAGRLPRAWAFARTFVAEVQRDRLLGLAAETAFFAVLSVFPGLLVAVSLLGLLESVAGASVADEAQEQVLQTLRLVLTDRASGVLSSVEDLFDRSRGGLLGFATLGALVTLSGAFAVAVNALNSAYDTVEGRSWLRRRLLGLLLAVGTLVLAVLALTVLVVGPLLGRGPRLAELVGMGEVFSFLWDVARLPVMGLVAVGWAVAMLHLAPHRRLPWRASVPGALLATLLWLVASAGFRLYLEVVADGNPVLGAFGGGAIVMTWVYLLSLSLLLGGELNAVLHDRRHLSDDGPAEAEPEAVDQGVQLALFGRVGPGGAG